MFQRGSPGSEFSGTGPRREAVGRAPGRDGPPDPVDWQPAAGMAAAPAAKPMKARRERREGEPMRPILPRQTGGNRNDLRVRLIGRATIRQNLRRRARKDRPGCRCHREKGDKWPPTRPARHNGDHRSPPVWPPSAIRAATAHKQGAPGMLPSAARATAGRRMPAPSLRFAARSVAWRPPQAA